MKLATYNVEWFNSLFNDDGQLINDKSWSSRWNVTKAAQTKAISRVFKFMDADAIMIIEAPDSSRNRNGDKALEAFARTYGLRTTAAVSGFTNDTQQEISLLYDPKELNVSHTPHGTDAYPAFDQLHGDIVWSKPPLEVTLSPQKKGQPVHLIGVHAKSKAPHGAKTDDQAVKFSIENRRKQLAQCTWLRGRVDELLTADIPLIVMGDFNDGPGLDQYEKHFGKSGVEIVLGDDTQTQLFDPHAHMALTTRIGTAPSTSRFLIRDERRYLNALLDYIMVSPDLNAQNPEWRILHPFDDPDCWANKKLRDALLTASDHFPVTITL
jgi:endonuclease/exonuclease/phosphatase family metal-dependent hydrolase